MSPHPAWRVTEVWWRAGGLGPATLESDARIEYNLCPRMASEKRTRSLPSLSELDVETDDLELRTQLREAIAAFVSGDYHRVRVLTAVLHRSRDSRVVASADELRRRVSIDPLQVVFLVLCLGVIGAIAYLSIPLP